LANTPLSNFATKPNLKRIETAIKIKKIAKMMFKTAFPVGFTAIFCPSKPSAKPMIA
jgi:hypothetical protein